MCLLIWTVFSGERCGPWASCLKLRNIRVFSVYCHFQLIQRPFEYLPACLIFLCEIKFRLIVFNLGLIFLIKRGQLNPWWPFSNWITDIIETDNLTICLFIYLSFEEFELESLFFMVVRLKKWTRNIYIHLQVYVNKKNVHFFYWILNLNY